MDEVKLQYLSKLENNYPYFQDGYSKADIPHLYYLYEKGFINLYVSHYLTDALSSSTYGKQSFPDFLLSERDLNDLVIKAKITAHGLDAIDNLMTKLKEKKKFTPKDASKGKLNALIHSPIYQELKDLATTIIAKFGAEVSK